MKNRLVCIFSNPFEELPSNQLMIIGLLFYVLSSIFVYYTSNHFEGLISVKSGSNTSLMLSFYNNGIAIVFLSLGAYLFGKVRNSGLRLIDVVNVVLISRIVIYIILLLIIEPFFVKDIFVKVELAILDDDFMLQSLSNLDRIILTVVGILAVFGLLFYFYFFISGLRFVINSKTKIDIFWILLVFLGLEVLCIGLGLNIN